MVRGDTDEIDVVPRVERVDEFECRHGCPPGNLVPALFEGDRDPHVVDILA